MANTKTYDALENERFLGWSWEVLETYQDGGVNVINDGECRFHFLVDIPSDFPGEFTGQPETLLTDRRFKHGTERTINNRYLTSYRYLSAWHIRNGTKANQGGFDRFYNNIFRWKSAQNSDINDFDAWGYYAEINSLANTALPAGYPGFETAVVYEQGNATLGLPYNMGAYAGPDNNLDHDYPPYKYHCDASNLTDVHDIGKYLDRPNTETASTVMTNTTLPTDIFNLAWTLDGSPNKPSASTDAETWIRSRLQIEQYDITYKTYWGLPVVEDQGEVTWIIKNVTPQHLYDPTNIGPYPEPYLYAYILTPTKIRPVKLHPSAYGFGSNYTYNHPSTSLSPGGMHFFNNDDEVLFGEKVPWCGGGGGGGGGDGTTSSYYSDQGATAADSQGNDITSYITKIVQKYNAGTSSWDTIAEINDPHTNPWDVPYVSNKEGDKYKIIYNVKDINNVAAESKTRLINIITTSLDLPNEPELDEFLGNDPTEVNGRPQDYEWRVYYRPSVSSVTLRPTDYRYMLLKYKADDDENYESPYESSRYRWYTWFPETNQGDDLAAEEGDSSYQGNRRYLNQKAIDLMFPFGIYKPMNPNQVSDVYFNKNYSYESLAMREGAIEKYLDVNLPIYNSNGTAGTSYAGYKSEGANSQSTTYSLTWDGFDPDLWQYGTTMAAGFRLKGSGYDFSLSREFWRSTTFRDSGSYAASDLGFSDFRYDDENPNIELDGYMYFRGPEKMSREDATTINPSVRSQSFNHSNLMGDNIFTELFTYNATNRGFNWTIARKPLSSDHTMQTVADALKERRSNRTTNKVTAAPLHHYLMDGSIKKFQSGEYYYPTNSPRNGVDFNSVTADPPFGVEGKIDNASFNNYFYAKDVIIGST